MSEKDKIVNELMKEHPIIEIVSFNETNVQEKLEDISFRIIKYMDLHHSEDAKLKHIQDLYDKICGKRYDHYRFNMDKELTKVEIEKFYLPQDTEVLKIKGILRRQEIRTRFFEICVRGLEKMSWSMKTFSENMRRGI